MWRIARCTLLIALALAAKPTQADPFIVDLDEYVTWCVTNRVGAAELETEAGRTASFERGVAALEGAARRAGIRAIGIPFAITPVNVLTDPEGRPVGGIVTTCSAIGSTAPPPPGVPVVVTTQRSRVAADTCEAADLDATKDAILAFLREPPFAMAAADPATLRWHIVRAPLDHPSVEAIARALTDADDHAVPPEPPLGQGVPPSLDWDEGVVEIDASKAPQLAPEERKALLAAAYSDLQPPSPPVSPRLVVAVELP